MAPHVSLLRVEDVVVRRGGQQLVSSVTFEASRGELVALMGPSGAGKTTVLRAVAGLDPIAAGTIEIDGLRLTSRRPGAAEARALHRRVGMVFQFHHLFAHMSALQNVMLAPLHVLKQRRADAQRTAEALLTQLGVGHRGSALPGQLSGGEAQRVAIARALAMQPPVLLLDEPTASLDPARRGELAAALRQLTASGRTLLVATHDAEFARGCAHRVIVMDGGRIVRQGSAADLLA